MFVYVMQALSHLIRQRFLQSLTTPPLSSSSQIASISSGALGDIDDALQQFRGTQGLSLLAACLWREQSELGSNTSTSSTSSPIPLSQSQFVSRMMCYELLQLAATLCLGIDASSAMESGISSPTKPVMLMLGLPFERLLLSEQAQTDIEAMRTGAEAGTCG